MTTFCNRITLALLFNILGCYFVSAQNQAKQLDKAAAFYKEADYGFAIEIFEELLKKPEDNKFVNADHLEVLGDCYRKINNFQKAEATYQLALQKSPDKYALYYDYADALFNNGNYSEAKTWFEKYRLVREADPRPVKMSAMIDRLKKISPAFPDANVIQSDLSAPDANDFGIAFYGPGKVAFISDRPGLNKQTNEWTGRTYLDIFTAEIGPDGVLGKTAYLEKGVNTNMKHEGAACFTNDGNTIYFAQNYVSADVSEKLNYRIMAASKSGGKWRGAEELGFNVERFSFTQPCLSHDGMLMYFASNRPGGYGGYDIWVCHYENKHWRTPINLGPEVNTEGDELFPFVHADGTLYFSSKNGSHLGYGGMDIFYASPDASGIYKHVINAGLPINSSRDDRGLILNEDKTMGYFISNRAPKERPNDDIFVANLNTKPAVFTPYVNANIKTATPVEDVAVGVSPSSFTPEPVEEMLPSEPESGIVENSQKTNVSTNVNLLEEPSKAVKPNQVVAPSLDERKKKNSPVEEKKGNSNKKAKKEPYINFFEEPVSEERVTPSVVPTPPSTQPPVIEAVPAPATVVVEAVAVSDSASMNAIGSNWKKKNAKKSAPIVFVPKGLAEEPSANVVGERVKSSVMLDGNAGTTSPPQPKVEVVEAVEVKAVQPRAVANAAVGANGKGKKKEQVRIPSLAVLQDIEPIHQLVEVTDRIEHEIFPEIPQIDLTQYFSVVKDGKTSKKKAAKKESILVQPLPVEKQEAVVQNEHTLNQPVAKVEVPSPTKEAAQKLTPEAVVPTSKPVDTPPVSSTVQKNTPKSEPIVVISEPVKAQPEIVVAKPVETPPVTSTVKKNAPKSDPIVVIPEPVKAQPEIVVAKPVETPPVTSTVKKNAPKSEPIVVIPEPVKAQPEIVVAKPVEAPPMTTTVKKNAPRLTKSEIIEKNEGLRRPEGDIISDVKRKTLDPNEEIEFNKATSEPTLSNTTLVKVEVRSTDGASVKGAVIVLTPKSINRSKSYMCDTAGNTDITVENGFLYDIVVRAPGFKPVKLPLDVKSTMLVNLQAN